VKRQYRIQSPANGTATAQESGEGMLHSFADVLSAVAFVRRQKGNEDVFVAFFDAKGHKTHAQLI
jgi:hypothetical protein